MLSPMLVAGQCGRTKASPLRAGAFLLKAKEFAPKDLDNRYKLALVYLRVSQPQEAFKEATEILKQAPDQRTGSRPLLARRRPSSPEQIQAGGTGGRRNSHTRTALISK